MSIKRWLRRWLHSDDSGIQLANTAVASPADELPTAYRINVTRALNGHIVHVLTHKSNPYGPDWTGDVTVVPEGGDLMEAIKIGIAAAGLK